MNRWASWLDIKGTLNDSVIYIKDGTRFTTLWTAAWEKRSNRLKITFLNIVRKEFRDLIITFHKIIKSFWESREISACKQQGWKPTLNTHDLGGWHYIKNRHRPVKKTIQLGLGLHSSLKLYHVKWKPYIRNALKRCWLLYPWSGLVQSGMTRPHFKVFLETMDIVWSRLTRIKTTQIVINTKFTSQHLRWYGCQATFCMSHNSMASK